MSQAEGPVPSSRREFIAAAVPLAATPGLPMETREASPRDIFFISKYRGYGNPWLGGKGKHVGPYSLVGRDLPCEEGQIPRMASEYNQGPVVAPNRAAAPMKSFLETSDIVEALRCEGDHIELRLVESLGRGGKAEIRLDLQNWRRCMPTIVGHPPSGN